MPSPWPASRIDRVNLGETRILTIGLPLEEEGNDRFEIPDPATRRGEFVTGDKNVLSLAATVQYRIAEPQRFLFGASFSEQLLGVFLEQEVTNIVARSGVDYVHPLGLNELRRLLTESLQKSARAGGLGIEIEDINLNDVRPPLLVKQAFLEVANARAERARLISEAEAQEARLLADAQAQAHQLKDRAETERHARVSLAQAEADRFAVLLESMRSSGDEQARQGALQRLYLSAIGEIFPRLQGRVLLDGEQPVDVSILKSVPASEEPAGSSQPKP
ncbi:MAG: SPFH domain-containing protein [Planctomycetales bacterium]